MRLAVYRTIFSSSQLNFPISRELIRKFSYINRSTKYSSPRNNFNSWLPAMESKQCEQQPESYDFPGPAIRKDRSLVSNGAASFRYKSKRKTKTDLKTVYEPILNRDVEGINSLQAGVSVLTSESQQEDDFSLPTSFGKKKRAPFASGVGTQSSNSNKPFDICCDEPVMLEPTLDDNCGGEQLTVDRSIEENGQVLRPGMVLLKNYIQLHDQVDIVKKCRELGLGRGGFYQPRFKDGAKLRLHMMCLGKDWDPQTKRYGERRQHDGSKPPDMPPSFDLLIDRALQDSYALIRRDLKTNDVDDLLPGISPDICIINFYNTSGRLGLHQDRDESKESLLRGLPVVSVSIGDSAEFLYGDERDVKKAKRVLLESGDVLIFGGESRHIFHGVASILQNTAPPHLITSTMLRPGRLNLTFRQF